MNKKRATIFCGLLVAMGALVWGVSFCQDYRTSLAVYLILGISGFAMGLYNIIFKQNKL